MDVPLAGVVEDFDGDGNPDVAVPDQATGKVFVLFGDGTGDFSTVTELAAGIGTPAGTAPDLHTVVSGDFNGDGRRDLAAANQTSRNFKTFLNLGNRQFDGGTATAVGPFVWSIAAADFNRDGNDDVVVGTSRTELRIGTIVNEAYLYPGNGAGGFGARTRFLVLRNADSMVSADFNKDGHPDLAVASGLRQAVDLLINNGAGGLFPSRLAGFPAGQMRFALGRWTLAPADFDGDGNLDLVVGNTDAAVSVLLGNGAGSLAAPVRISTGAGTGQQNSVAVADFNRDGAVDIVGSSLNTRNLTVLLNDGAGGFGAPVNIDAAAPTLNAVRTGDFNGDGLPDLVSGSNGDDVVFTLIADPSSASVFAAPPGEFSVLARNPDGSFTRTFKDGSVSAFDADGRLTAKIDRNDNRTDYAYDAAGRLETITDPTGKVSTFAYGADGRLAASPTPPAESRPMPTMPRAT